MVIPTNTNSQFDYEAYRAAKAQRQQELLARREANAMKCDACGGGMQPYLSVKGAGTFYRCDKDLSTKKREYADPFAR